MTGEARQFDLVILGTGSGNSIPGPELDDWSIAIVEKGVFGGTCLNRGCIPSKMLVYTADVVEQVRRARKFGVTAHVDGIDWPAIVQRVYGRIDPIATGGRRYRVEDCPNITVFEGEARFVDHKVVEVDGERLTGRHIVIGVGARPQILPIPGIEEVPFHTSDDIMRIEGIPDRLVVLGGGFIAAELSHVFDAMGSTVTVVNRNRRLLRLEDEDVSRRYTEVMGRRFELVLGASFDAVSQDGDGIHVDVTCDGERFRVTGDVLLVATGRIPNGDLLDLDASGIRHDNGRVLVDDAQRTNVEGVWAFGDVSNELQLKHLANLEAKVVAHNILHPDDLRHIDASLTPHAVFGLPQVASVGLNERDAIERGIPHVAVRRDYSSTAYGWAMEDTDGFAKLVVHAHDRTVLGAHIIGPQAPTLLQQLVQGMALGSTVDDMAHAFMYVHPALPELTENVLLEAISVLDGRRAVSLAGTQPLHVDVHAGAGPPVLLIHGFLSSRAHWSANLGALADVCTPVVVELLGHGRTPLPEDPAAWLPTSYVDYFEIVREQCGVDRWPVIGHSLGGALALGYALDRPERVDGVVFTNSQSALASESWRRAMLPELKAQADQLRGPAGARILERHPMHPRRSRRIAADIREALIADYEVLTPEAVAATMDWTIPTSSVRDRFHLVSRPTMLTVGTDEEGFQGPAIFARETLPGLEVVELAAGHNVNLHDPVGWNAAVTGFIRTVLP